MNIKAMSALLFVGLSLALIAFAAYPDQEGGRHPDSIPSIVELQRRHARTAEIVSAIDNWLQVKGVVVVEGRLQVPHPMMMRVAHTYAAHPDGLDLTPKVLEFTEILQKARVTMVWKDASAMRIAYWFDFEDSQGRATRAMLILLR